MNDQEVAAVVAAIKPIYLDELLSVIATVDLGEINYRFIEGYKRFVPSFGTKGRSMMVRHTFSLEPVKDLKSYVMDKFIDEETRKIKNTPLSFSDAVEEFSNPLLSCGRTPTHVVDLGNSIYAIIAAEDIEVRVGMHDNKVVATLVNTFDRFPVFRCKETR